MLICILPGFMAKTGDGAGKKGGRFQCQDTQNAMSSIYNGHIYSSRFFLESFACPVTIDFCLNKPMFKQQKCITRLNKCTV